MKTLLEAKMQYEYFINLDERGEFYADVRDPDGNTVYKWEFLTHLQIRNQNESQSHVFYKLRQTRRV